MRFHQPGFESTHYVLLAFQFIMPRTAQSTCGTTLNTFSTRSILIKKAVFKVCWIGPWSRFKVNVTNNTANPVGNTVFCYQSVCKAECTQTCSIGDMSFRPGWCRPISQINLLEFISDHGSRRFKPTAGQEIHNMLAKNVIKLISQVTSVIPTNRTTFFHTPVG